MTPPCAQCGSPKTREHCFNAACDWITCENCRATTWIRRTPA